MSQGEIKILRDLGTLFITDSLIDSQGKRKVVSNDLALIYEAEYTGDYYLFVDNKKGHGGSYQGTILISSDFSSRSKKITHTVYDKADVALP